MIYLCSSFDAYVRVHEGTDKALGRLSKYKLNEARKEARSYFDQITKTFLINSVYNKWIGDTNNRSKAYQWLSEQMEISFGECYIGMFHG